MVHPELLVTTTLRQVDYEHIKRFFKNTIKFSKLTDAQKNIVYSMGGDMQQSTATHELAETLKRRLLEDNILSKKQADDFDMRVLETQKVDFLFQEMDNTEMFLAKAKWSKYERELFDKLSPTFSPDLKKLPRAKQLEKFSEMLRLELTTSQSVAAKEWRSDMKLPEPATYSTHSQKTVNDALHESFNNIYASLNDELKKLPKNVAEQLYRKAVSHIIQQLPIAQQAQYGYFADIMGTTKRPWNPFNKTSKKISKKWSNVAEKHYQTDR